LEIGQAAPDFKLKNVDGRMISLADVKDANGNAPKGYIVTFTCNTCPFAVMYEDRIIDLHNRFAPKGWPVVAIQPNDVSQKPGDGFEEMKIRAKEKGFPYVYLIDEKQEVYPKYGATKTPHVFLLDANRIVKYIGAIDNNAQDAAAADRHYVAEAIAAIEAGKTPDPATTKAIGCGIKG
jgi:peroxiredoxin